MIYTVIVSYNGIRWLEKCFNSILKSTIATTIIVVDNGSTDGTIEFIKSKYPTIQLIQQSQNLGFGKANNIGISRALELGADFIFLLNQDTTIDENCLELLFESAKKNQDFGVLSPVHYNYSGSNYEYYFKKFASKNDLFDTETTKINFLESIYEVPYVNAAAWFIPKRTLEIIGGFDPIFKHYGEDNNYCQRLQYHELKIGVVSNANIFHDSKKRQGTEIELFSNAYLDTEVKQLHVQYANINIEFATKQKNKTRKHNVKLVLRNLIRFKRKNVLGYLKKIMIFEKEFKRIDTSRCINKTLGKHYI